MFNLIGPSSRNNFRQLRFREDDDNKREFLNSFPKLPLENINQISVIDSWLDDER